MTAYHPDFLNGGTASASGEDDAASQAFDNSISTRWSDRDGSPWWVKYDLGAGVAKTPIRVRWYTLDSTWSPKDWTFAGSNNDSDWTTLITVDGTAKQTGYVDNAFANTTAYRYFRFTIDVNHGGATEGQVYEIEAFEEAAGGFFVNMV